MEERPSGNTDVAEMKESKQSRKRECERNKGDAGKR
jgi:hypothetical protein